MIARHSSVILKEINNDTTHSFICVGSQPERMEIVTIGPDVQDLKIGDIILTPLDLDMRVFKDGDNKLYITDERSINIVF